MGASSSSSPPPPREDVAEVEAAAPRVEAAPPAPPPPPARKRPRRSCRGPPPKPCCVLVAGGATAVVRERSAQVFLHGGARCFGQVRAVAGTLDDRAPGASEAPKFGSELRLTGHELRYLSEGGLVDVVEAVGGAPLSAAAVRRTCVAWAPRGEARAAAEYAVYKHFRRKRWIVKPGLQFGCDFMLYRRSPDEFHAEYCVVVVERDADGDDERVPWHRLKANARLSSDVRKHLCLAYAPPPGSDDAVVEILVDDAFGRPADACAGKRRQKVPEAADAHAKTKRKRSEAT